MHPSRPIDHPLDALRSWTEREGVGLVQVPVPGQHRPVADFGDPAECDLIVSIGGDGTMLAAIRAAVGAERPALGVACGSLGVLTTVDARALPGALDRFGRGDWVRRLLPSLHLTAAGADDRFAINDIAIVRGGIGQVRVTSRVGGILFSRLAGDGCVVSTPLGSSAYSLAAGGPLLTPDAQAYVLTPLPTHGGSRQPLVIAAASELTLEVSGGIGGVRLEIDGQRADPVPAELSITFTPATATLVGFPDQEPLFTGLRRRRIIADSPRILADDGTL